MEELLRVENLKKYFPLKLGFFKSIISRKPLFVKAVDDISFHINKKEIFGLAGESGSGKTTTGRLILRLVEPSGGRIYFKGKDISNIPDKDMKNFRKQIQMIFQDPYESLNPRFTVYDTLAEPLRIHREFNSEKEIRDRILTSLEEVKITPPEQFLFRYPHELSGGQRQRVALARSLILKPEFIVADEPVSMLDVSIRAEVLNLMLDLIYKHNVSFLYITHDLALARHICDRIAILYLGKMMEMADAEKIVYEPLHPYTKALIAAVPIPDPTVKRSEAVIKGEIPSPINPPSGCRFHTRCPSYIGDICRTREPELVDVGGEHFVACHLYDKGKRVE